MNIADMQVYWASDLKDFGRTEDGTPFIGEVFFVEAENKRGDRWRLKHYFPGVKVVQGEEGPIFQDVRAEVYPKLDRLVDSIKRVKNVADDQWSVARCAYGSAAYLDYGMAEELALEKMEG